MFVYLPVVLATTRRSLTSDRLAPIQKVPSPLFSLSFSPVLYFFPFRRERVVAYDTTRVMCTLFSEFQLAYERLSVGWGGGLAGRDKGQRDTRQQHGAPAPPVSHHVRIRPHTRGPHIALILLFLPSVGLDDRKRAPKGRGDEVTGGLLRILQSPRMTSDRGSPRFREISCTYAGEGRSVQLRLRRALVRPPLTGTQRMMQKSEKSRDSTRFFSFSLQIFVSPPFPAKNIQKSANFISISSSKNGIFSL